MTAMAHDSHYLNKGSADVSLCLHFFLQEAVCLELALDSQVEKESRA
jgi:hypothetical protein